jgi:hypothetical protein
MGAILGQYAVDAVFGHYGDSEAGLRKETLRAR